ncbi:MAG: hypothetical protein WA863_16175, partial [Methyloceanibacter sp.]
MRTRSAVAEGHALPSALKSEGRAPPAERGTGRTSSTGASSPREPSAPTTLLALPGKVGTGLHTLKGAAAAGAKWGQTGATRSPLGSRIARDLAWFSPGSAATLTSSPGSVKGAKSGPSGPRAIPSPWAPSRSILTSSSMAGADQHFLIAAAPKNWGGHLSEHRPARCRVDKGPYRRHGLGASVRVTDDDAVAHSLRPASNCGVTKATSVRRGGGPPAAPWS